jgi:hypothetical protein
MIENNILKWLKRLLIDHTSLKMQLIEDLRTKH